VIKLQLYYNELPEYLRNNFYNRLQKKITLLDGYINNSYPHPILLKVNADQTKTSEFEIKAILFLDKKSFPIVERGRDINIVLENVFTILKQNLLRHLNKKKKHPQANIVEARNQIFDEVTEKLVIDVESEDQKSFSDEITQLLKPLKKYVRGRIILAQNIGIKQAFDISEDDVFEEVIETAFQNFHQIPGNLTLKEWLYQLSNTALKKVLSDEYRHQEIEVSLENFSKEEIGKTDMEQVITTNYKGAPITNDSEVYLLPEIEDIFYKYLEPEFVGYRIDLTTKANRQWLVGIISKLPAKYHSLLVLLSQGLPKKEAANIFDLSQEELDKIINEIKEKITSEIGNISQ
jgi:DNA-directed RNA polymerase specialized sigma24 family protein/ribosome-associated translation inhibitor RaiA